MKKTGKYDLQVDFFNFDNRKGENIFLVVKRIGERFEIKGTVHRKNGSCQPRASTI